MIDKEVVAIDERHVARRAGFLCPGLRLSLGNMRIGVTRKHRDRHCQARRSAICIYFRQLEVGAQGRQNQVHEGAVGHYFGRRTVIFLQFLEQFVIRQRVQLA